MYLKGVITQIRQFKRWTGCTVMPGEDHLLSSDTVDSRDSLCFMICVSLAGLKDRIGLTFIGKPGAR